MKRISALICVLAMLMVLFTGCGAKQEPAAVEMPDTQATTPSAPVDTLVQVETTAKENPTEEAPQQTTEGYYTIYAQMPQGWSSINLWAWSESIGDLYDAWPGQPMSLDGSGWYVMTIPQEYDYVVVNDGGVGAQTNDEYTGGQDVWFMLYEDSYEVFFQDPATSSIQTEAIPEEEPQQTLDGYYTVYAQIPKSWNCANLWAWSESIGDLYDAWPGQPMSLDGSGWYVMTIPQEYDYVIVNDGGAGAQIDDEYTGGRNIWIRVFDEYYESFFQPPAGAPTITVTPYDMLFIEHGATEVSYVSRGLSVLSAAKLMENGAYIEQIDFGSKNGTVQEAVISMHYFLDGMTAQEKNAIAAETGELFRETLGMYDFMDSKESITNSVYTFSIIFRDLDEFSNIEAVADLFEFTVSQGKPTPAPTAEEFESMGYVTKSR